MNDTVQGNILFGAPLDAERYARVVTACQLDDDIAFAAERPMTEIGERGITISGGQKQRISIARAAYSEASVVLLDDPLSAMDAHVGGNLFNQCIMKEICDRAFRTNQLQFAPRSDRIYFLRDGAITESGTFKELMKIDGGDFAALYAHVSSGIERQMFNEGGAAAAAPAPTPRAPPAPPQPSPAYVEKYKAEKVAKPNGAANGAERTPHPRLLPRPKSLARPTRASRATRPSCW